MKKQCTLGDLIDQVKFQSKYLEKDATVYFDFCGFSPDGIDSYRGFYDELALGYSKDKKIMSIDEFLSMLEFTVGVTLTGYKGGEFTMTKKTPVWVSNYGEYDKTAITGVTADSYLGDIKGFRLIINTKSYDK